MKQNFSFALEDVLLWEGGFVNHSEDPGGPTNKGITLRNYRKYINPNGTVEDLKNLSFAELEKFYKLYYWDAVKGDQLPHGIDLAVFDFAVNSGPTRAVKFLQAVVGTDADGVIGTKTLEKVWESNHAETIRNLCDRRMVFLRHLRIFKTFGKGWKRRVKGVEQRALGLVKKENVKNGE